MIVKKYQIKPTSSKIGLQFHNLETGCQQERKVLKLTVKDVPRRLNYQIWVYKQLKVMLQVNLLYSFHALCCKIKM